MISIYLRCSPQVARHLQLFKEEIRAAAEGTTVENALRIMPASTARAAAAAVFQAEIVPPPQQMTERQVTAEGWRIAQAEIQKLQLEPVAYRQRLEEAEAKAARDREQAAADLARVVGERDEAMRDAVRFADRYDPSCGCDEDEAALPGDLNMRIESYRKQLADNG